MLNPYATLPPLPIGDKEELVNEGTGAMRAYQAMLYGKADSTSEMKETWKRLLLQYCELDTMAMVIIFEHWWRSTIQSDPSFGPNTPTAGSAEPYWFECLSGKLGQAPRNIARCSI